MTVVEVRFAQNDSGGWRFAQNDSELRPIRPLRPLRSRCRPIIVILSGAQRSRRISLSSLPFVAAGINRRGATATTQLLLTTPRHLFCHIERSAAQSKYLSIIGYSWVGFACWVLWVRTTAFVGYVGSMGYMRSVGYTKKSPSNPCNTSSPNYPTQTKNQHGH